MHREVNHHLSDIGPDGKMDEIHIIVRDKDASFDELERDF